MRIAFRQRNSQKKKQTTHGRNSQMYNSKREAFIDVCMSFIIISYSYSYSYRIVIVIVTVIVYIM